jgi:site-specific DNA-methyltransferase (cytosine-N4-specific)
MEDLSAKVSKLAETDWDFSDATARDPIHGIHPYPAKFIPQIPRKLIELFPPKNGTAVLDPFCGSGTTLVEAVRARYPAIGIDINPLATLIAKVKTTPLRTSIVPLAEHIVSQAKSTPITVPSIPRIDHWFQGHVQDALARVIHQIQRVHDQDAQDALKVAFASIVVRVSNQESDTRYAAVSKKVSTEDVYRAFLRAARSVDQAIQQEYGGMFREEPHCTVLTRDVLSVKRIEIQREVGLVVTSPPYPNAYEYWLYHKYRMYWLGMNPISVRESEIGARPHYFGKKRQSEIDFERQMGRCFEFLAEVMTADATACFLVGRSIIRGRTIDNRTLLIRAAAPYGLYTIGEASRRIPSNRKTFNPIHSTIDTETILLFSRRKE